MIRQLIIDLTIASTLFLLMEVKLLQLLMNLFAVHLIDIDIWSLLSIRCLKGLHMHLVF
jgi:hypothetical protein